MANYPLKGKLWCAEQLGMKEHQVRSKASSLKIKARGVSEAWQQKQRDHSSKLTGRKRPAQREVMRRAILDKGLHVHGPEIRAQAGRKTAQRFAVVGHPRGMLGKRHSDGARARMIAAHRKRGAETAEQKQRRTLKAIRTRAERGVKARARTGSTWKAGWREIDGRRRYFRSRWEANYARYLSKLRALGAIAEWEHEPRAFLFESVEDGCGSYLPDFRVTAPAGGVSYHEVKGWLDARSKAAFRLMASQHPEITLVVVDSTAYRALAARYAKAIPGWET